MTDNKRLTMTNTTNEYDLIDSLALELGISSNESKEARNSDTVYQRHVLRKALNQIESLTATNRELEEKLDAVNSSHDDEEAAHKETLNRLENCLKKSIEWQDENTRLESRIAELDPITAIKAFKHYKNVGTDSDDLFDLCIEYMEALLPTQPIEE